MMVARKLLDTRHGTAKGLYDASLMDTRTMREFDALSLEPVKSMSAAQIRRLRRRNHVSEAVFAAYLNTSISTVQKWERGQKKPSGPTTRLFGIFG